MLLFPHINVSIELCGSANKTYLNKLQVLHNLLLKTLTKRNRCDSTDVLHRELSILKVRELYQLNALIFVYKRAKNYFLVYSTNFINVIGSSRTEVPDIK